MRRAIRSRALRARALPCLLLLLALAACGRDKPASELTFESLPDTTGLTDGLPVVQEFEPYRMANGAVRVKGRVRVPDGTLLQVAIKQPGGRVSVAMAQVRVQGHTFDTPPLLGENGPLPKGDYRFELLSHFTPLWQGAEGAGALRAGPSLRGPGITRARDGAAALFLVKEGRL
jgi:hypothetical protein